jgi:hypothetical protein
MLASRSAIDGFGTVVTGPQDNPNASGPDTQQVVLEICRDEGLQQVIWVSRDFPEAELSAVMLASRSAIDGFGTVVTGPQDNPNGASAACAKARTRSRSSLRSAGTKACSRSSGSAETSRKPNSPHATSDRRWRS